MNNRRDVARARSELLSYLAERDPGEPALGESQLRHRLRRAIPARLRPGLATLVTDAIRPWERRKANRLSRRSPLLLHLGSARSAKPGWVNVDLWGHPVDLAWNVRHELPFSADVIDAIFHEHLLEHLTIADAPRLTIESCRVLKPGGILRVGVPNTGAYLSDYVEGRDEFIARNRPSRPTPLLAIQEAFYSWGHLSMYDGETLTLLMHAGGFGTVECKPFGMSAIHPVPDSEHRREETLYIEAVKAVP